MESNDVNVSAFAMYSNVNKKKTSRNQKRRLKMKEMKRLEENVSLDAENGIKTRKLKKKSHDEVAHVNSMKLLPKQKSFLKSKGSDPNLQLNGKKKKTLKESVSAGIFNSVPEALSESNENSKVTANCDTTGILKKNGEPVDMSDCNNVSLEKKSRKLKRKKFENPSPGSEQFSSNEDIDRENEHQKQKKKKVFIASPEPITERNSKVKKSIVCTPRFLKTGKVIKEFGNKRQLIDVSPSKILQKVDKYLVDKKDVELKISNRENSPKNKGPRPIKNIVLAQMAKAEVNMKSSEAAGKYTFEKILEPISVDSFMREHWEKSPIHIAAHDSKKFSKLISTEGVDAVLRDRIVNFGKHLDVTSYTDGKRETHNLEGRANAHVVWDFYSNGCSVRLLNPQSFFHSVHSLNAMLQEFFGCFVGANSYLTPPMSQGFAPHYDDIEAFILQIEGSKIWKLYKPMDKNGYLPRLSSRNLLDDEIGEPILEVKLNPGDLLYFPRGYIHQGRTEEEHSLHLTLSVYQKTAWCDFLEKLIPLTLKKAASQDVEFRKGLPIGYLKSAGLLHKNAPSRKDIIKKVKNLVTRLNDFLETDAAMDQMGLSFIQDALPPVLTVSEAACTVTADGWKMRANGRLQGQVIITPNTKVRWTRAFCYRILEEEVILEDGTIEKQIRIYHSLENSKEYHAEEPQYLVIDVNMLSSLRHLTAVYPKFTKICELPSDDEDGKVLFVSDLWDRGLLMTDSPLELYSNSNSAVESKEILTTEELEILSDLEEKIPKGGENESLSTSSSEAETEESSDDDSSENIGEEMTSSENENSSETDSE